MTWRHEQFAEWAEQRVSQFDGETLALLAIYHLLESRLPRTNPLDVPGQAGSGRPPQPNEPSSNDIQKGTNE